MKRISIILMTFQMLLGVILFGQENNNKNKNLKNTVFVEALRNGLFGSINYERQLTKERTRIKFKSRNWFLHRI